MILGGFLPDSIYSNVVKATFYDDDDDRVETNYAGRHVIIIICYNTL